MDGTTRWQSKLEGVLDAGVGMHVFIAHAAIGGGANLVCTVLLLTLLKRVELGRPLGSILHLQLDNTTGENKNATVFGFMALLVHWGVFNEAVVFFMPKGHTFNLLDQTFGPLINAMKGEVMATMTDMLNMMHRVIYVWLLPLSIQPPSHSHHPAAPVCMCPPPPSPPPLPPPTLDGWAPPSSLPTSHPMLTHRC